MVAAVGAAVVTGLVAVTRVGGGVPADGVPAGLVGVTPGVVVVGAAGVVGEAGVVGGVAPVLGGVVEVGGVTTLHVCGLYCWQVEPPPAASATPVASSRPTAAASATIPILNLAPTARRCR